MGKRTEKLLLEDIVDVGLVGLRVDITEGYASFHLSHDAGDIIAGSSQDAGILGMSHAVERIETLSNLYIIEEKYKATDANKYLQEDGDKFDSMIEFAEAIGATPVLAVRWSQNLDWSPGPYHLLCDAREVRRTSSGNVSVKPETAKAEYERVSDFF